MQLRSTSSMPASKQIKQGRAQLKLKQADAQAQTTRSHVKLQVGQVALAQFQNRALTPPPNSS